MNIYTTLIYFIILWTPNEIKAQTAQCSFGNKFYSTFGLRSTNKNIYYSCYLNTQDANFNQMLEIIEGEHDADCYDSNVKLINIGDESKLKIFTLLFCLKFPKLQIIRTNHAEVESIRENSLASCKDLEVFESNGNKIESLPEKLLTRNPKLISFSLKDNKLSTLPENLFLNNVELKSLDLGNNQINFLSSKIFTRLLKLERLVLSNNKINTLNSDSFDNLHNLQNLELHTNEISDLPTGIFTNLKNLKELNLNNNNLTSIHSDSFGISGQLTNVKLISNKINAIDAKFFTNSKISYLDMRNNICSKLEIKNRDRINFHLKTCFGNYKHRVNSSACGRALMPEGQIVGGTKIKRRSYPW